MVMMLFVQSDSCGEERPAVVLLPALRMPQSSAEGAAQGSGCP